MIAHVKPFLAAAISEIGTKMNRDVHVAGVGMIPFTRPGAKC
jgi:hypothetical protein